MKYPKVINYKGKKLTKDEYIKETTDVYAISEKEASLVFDEHSKWDNKKVWSTGRRYIIATSKNNALSKLNKYESPINLLYLGKFKTLDEPEKVALIKGKGSWWY